MVPSSFSLLPLFACRQRIALFTAPFCLSMLVLASCSGSGSPEAPAVELQQDAIGSEPLPQVLVDLKADTTVISKVPEIVHTQTLADSGLRVSYTQESLRSAAPVTAIEQQWVFMQRCVQQVGVAPLVVVREGSVKPFTTQDDVVRNENPMAIEISSVPVASASSLHGPVIQVSSTDFDGSIGTPLFNLRSIMGRYLWLSAGLPERDYPYECARTEPT